MDYIYNRHEITLTIRTNGKKSQHLSSFSSDELRNLSEILLKKVIHWFIRFVVAIIEQNGTFVVPNFNYLFFFLFFLSPENQIFKFFPFLFITEDRTSRMLSSVTCDFAENVPTKNHILSTFA